MKKVSSYFLNKLRHCVAAIREKLLETCDFTYADRHMPSSEMKTLIYNTVFCGVCGWGKVLSRSLGDGESGA